MVRENEIRKAEVAVTLPPTTDAGLMFIGRIRTPWTSRMETPRQGRADGPLCRIEIFEPWVPALAGLAQYERVEVLYWLHLSRRDLVLQSPANDGTSRGTFSLRSPARPNPIGTAIAHLVGIEGAIVMVRGLDCLGHTVARSQARSRTVHAHRAAATRRFANRRSVNPRKPAVLEDGLAHNARNNRLDSERYQVNPGHHGSRITANTFESRRT
jgi:tRNA-Thr(GGU) m(6)t(6)A37 methyltransferase TsaA